VGHAFLGMLDRGPQHGYSLKRDYDHWFGDGRDLRFGQVYATLSRLERDGLANVSAVESGDGPERKSYAITVHGVEELESWLASPVTPDEMTLGPLYAKVVVALLSGRAAGDVLTAQRTVHLARMRELRAVHDGAGFERQLAVDLLIGHLQADLDWIELAGARLSRRTGAKGRGR
jgi:DNA-binding PadR family transcriptional regulator